MKKISFIMLIGIIFLIPKGVCANSLQYDMPNIELKNNNYELSEVNTSYIEVNDESSLIESIAENNAIRLTSNITLTKSLVINKKITIDLNSKTINCGTFNIITYDTGNLIIDDLSSLKQGKITSSMSYGTYSGLSISGTIAVLNKGKLTVNEGIIENTDTTGFAAAIADKGPSTVTGNITITGGTFETPGGGNCIFLTSANLSISGGTFIGNKSNPAASFYSIGVLSGKKIEGVNVSITGGVFKEFTDSAIQLSDGDININDEITFLDNNLDINMNGLNVKDPTTGNYVPRFGVINLDDGFNPETPIKINAVKPIVFTTENSTDLSTYFDGSKNNYTIFNNDDNKLEFAKPTITSQPTSENPVVETDFTKNINYQWYKTITNYTDITTNDAKVYNSSASYVSFNSLTSEWDINTGNLYASTTLWAVQINNLMAGQKIKFTLTGDEVDYIGIYNFTTRNYEYAVKQSDGTYLLTLNSSGIGLLTLFLSDTDTTTSVKAQFVNKTDTAVSGQIGKELTRIGDDGNYFCELTWNNSLKIKSNAIAMEAKTVSATFNSSFGNVTPKEQRVITNRNATLSITPNDGYKVSLIEIGNIDVTNQLINGELLINNVTDDINVEVTFEEIPPLTIGELEKVIEELPNIGLITPDDKKDILDAKINYEKLTDEEKKEVDSNLVEKLNNALFEVSNVDIKLVIEDELEDINLSISNEQKAKLLENMTLEEARKIKNGTYSSYEIIIKIDNIEPSREELLLIENKSDTNSALKHYNIKVEKRIQGSEMIIENVLELVKPIRLVFTIDSELLNVDKNVSRDFKMYHMHNRRVVVLNDLDNNKNTYTIETNSFSIYTLGYKDTILKSPQNNKVLKNPKTGDSIISSVLLGSISLIGLFGTSLYLKKRKHS